MFINCKCNEEIVSINVLSNIYNEKNKMKNIMNNSSLLMNTYRYIKFHYQNILVKFTYKLHM